MLHVFLDFRLSLAFTVKAELLTENEKCIVCGNTFLKGIVTVNPALMVKGPCGAGGRQWPRRGMV